MSIPFASDDSRSLTVGVLSIVVTNSLLATVEPLIHPDFFLIDSTVPDLWLPRPTCDLFEQAFHLTFDNSTGLYLVNDSIHSRLVEMNPSVSIKISSHLANHTTVDIDLPYKAFDLQASSPIYPNATNYFPMRRAANNTQFTLGRTFLQEAYIIVDYERSNFSVHQAVFRDPNPMDIVTIHPKRAVHQRLSHGDIAGITIGIIAFFSLIATITIIVRPKSRARQERTPPAELHGGEAVEQAIWIPELDGKAEIPKTPRELDSPRIAVTPRSRHELDHSPVVSELPSPALPSTAKAAFFADSQQSQHDPENSTLK